MTTNIYQHWLEVFEKGITEVYTSFVEGREDSLDVHSFIGHTLKESNEYLSQAMFIYLSSLQETLYKVKKEGGDTPVKLRNRMEGIVYGAIGHSDYNSFTFLGESFQSRVCRSLHHASLPYHPSHLLPYGFNPVTQSYVDEKPPLADIEKYFSVKTCALTGEVKLSHHMHETVYPGVSISLSLDLNQYGWSIDTYSGKAYDKKDEITFTRRNGERVSRYNKPGLSITVGPDGKYYDFDIEAYPCRTLTDGYVSREAASDLEQLGDSDVYLNLNDFEPMDYSTDVLEIFDGFLCCEDEDIVRGNKVHQKNTLFMGVELEVEMSGRATIDVDEAAAEAMRVMKGHAVCVHDGSLGDGFEIVSVPATLQYHYGIWEELCTGSLRKQLVSFLRPSCGLHVHMTKESFSDYTLGMFITFINSSSNVEFINNVSGRGSNSYCQRKDTKVSRGKTRNRFVDISGARHDKYWATNLVNDHTIEVRMFKGTLSYSGVMKSLEFLHALHRYVTYNASHNKLDYKDFTAWFSDKKNACRKTYPFLWHFLCAKEYIEDTRKDTKLIDVKEINDSGESGKKEYKHTLDPHIIKLFRKSNGSSKGKLQPPTLVNKA